VITPELSAAVHQLRVRGLWTQVPVLLRNEEPDFETLFTIAAALVERCGFTDVGWDEGAEAMNRAVAAATTDEEHGRAALEQAFSYYERTVFKNRDMADQARARIRDAEQLIPDDSPLAPLLWFRRALITENLDGDLDGARVDIERADAAARAAGDDLALSFTARHLAILDWRQGNNDKARPNYELSLELRIRTGFLIGLAPAIAGVARVSDEPEASRLRAEAMRIVRTMGLKESLTR
jgi:hypothetical protein